MASEEDIHRQHLQWALNFCQTALDEDPERIEEIKTKIDLFIRGADRQPPGKRFGAVMPQARIDIALTSDHVKQIHEAFKEGFSGISDGTFIVTHTGPGAHVSFYVGALTPLSRFYQSVDIFSDRVSQAAVALELHLVRSGLTGERIRKCEECGLVFISDRRGQKYCSPKCAQAAANRWFYERKQRLNKLGIGVRVVDQKGKEIPIEPPPKAAKKKAQSPAKKKRRR